MTFLRNPRRFDTHYVENWSLVRDVVDHRTHDPGVCINAAATKPHLKPQRVLRGNALRLVVLKHGEGTWKNASTAGGLDDVAC